MKKLLSSIGTLIITGTSLGSLPIIGQTQINEKSTFEAVQYYWNDEHQEEVSEVIANNNNDPWIPYVSYKRTIYTINLGVKKPNFTNLSFINSNGFKASWRNEEWNWDAPNLAVSFEHDNYIKLADGDRENFDKFTTTTVYEHHAKAEAAEKANFITKIGTVWYNEDDVYYMQFLLYQYADLGPSLTNTAINYVSLGDKLELE